MGVVGLVLNSRGSATARPESVTDTAKIAKSVSRMRCFGRIYKYNPVLFAANARVFIAHLLLVYNIKIWLRLKKYNMLIFFFIHSYISVIGDTNSALYKSNLLLIFFNVDETTSDYF